MSEMVERAGNALVRFFDDHHTCNRAAELALLAALDPEDEALVEAVARSIMALDLDDAFGDWTNFRLRAVGAIAACNRMAQGGSVE